MILTGSSWCIVFFGEKATMLRLVGIGFLGLGLCFYGMTSSTGKCASGKWKLIAFLVMLMTGVVHNLNMVPSYMEDAKCVNSLVRSLFISAGTISAGVLKCAFQWKREEAGRFFSSLKSPQLWKYVALTQIVGLVIGYFIYIPGMNALAANGMGAACYPIMVGSCILSFTFLALFTLKEKTSKSQIAALICCLAGIVFLCH